MRMYIWDQFGTTFGGRMGGGPLPGGRYCSAVDVSAGPFPRAKAKCIEVAERAVLLELVKHNTESQAYIYVSKMKLQG